MIYSDKIIFQPKPFTIDYYLYQIIENIKKVLGL
jgi:hypothetical protein